MKKHYFSILMIVVVIMGMNLLLQAQDNTTVPQVIIANGGRFESNPPYYDYVTVGSYNTSTHTYMLFDTIYTQSVQDILITDHFAYVAAQDSIVKYDLDTYQRVAIVADSGLEKLGIYGDKLIVTKGYPVKRFFAEVRDAGDLALYSFIDNISGDCGGILATSDSVYMAVNGGYQGSEGKLAVIDPVSWTVTHEINFGQDAVGIWNLFGYNGYIYSINVTPGGSAQVGSITKCSQNNETFTNNILGVTVGDGVGIQGHLLYVGFNNGIGSYDLDNDAIADTNIVSDPGVPNHIYILAAALDYINNDLYLSFGNYSNPGKCLETTILGDSLTSFNVGISANAIAIEFLTPAGINPGTTRDEVLAISPNPVYNWMKVTFNGQEAIQAITISELTGRTIYFSDLKGNEKSVGINTSSFPPGIYFLSVSTNNGNIAKKFIKQ